MSVSIPYYDQPDGLRLDPSAGLDDELEYRLRSRAWKEILVYGDDMDDLASMIGDDFGLDERVFERVLEQLIAARRAQQEAWPPEIRETTLTRAFTELAEIGVVARQAFSCCGTCGASEIHDERDDSRVWRGYVFFDIQDAEHIQEGRQTYISYGVFLDSAFSDDEWNGLSDTAKDETYLLLVTELMRDEVFPVLARHGIEVEWDGDLGRRILLKNVDWYADVRVGCQP